jgi:hypothetical protein
MMAEGSYPRPFVCARCGHVLGQLLEIEGIHFVQAGGLILERFDGRCPQCGCGIHSAIPLASYRRLLRLYGMEVNSEITFDESSYNAIDKPDVKAGVTPRSSDDDRR